MTVDTIELIKEKLEENGVTHISEKSITSGYVFEMAMKLADRMVKSCETEDELREYLNDELTEKYNRIYESEYKMLESNLSDSEKQYCIDEHVKYLVEYQDEYY